MVVKEEDVIRLGPSLLFAVEPSPYPCPKGPARPVIGVLKDATSPLGLASSPSRRFSARVNQDHLSSIGFRRMPLTLQTPPTMVAE